MNLPLNTVSQGYYVRYPISPLAMVLAQIDIAFSKVDPKVFGCV